MTPDASRICPLCQTGNARADLAALIASEHPFLRRRTISLIQAYHPGWQEEHGACWPCWKSYRDATKALGLLNSAKPAPAFSS